MSQPQMFHSYSLGVINCFRYGMTSTKSRVLWLKWRGGAISAVIFVFLYKNDKKVKGPARFFAERYVTECIKY